MWWGVSVYNLVLKPCLNIWPGLFHIAFAKPLLSGRTSSRIVLRQLPSRTAGSFGNISARTGCGENQYRKWYVLTHLRNIHLDYRGGSRSVAVSCDAGKHKNFFSASFLTEIGRATLRCSAGPSRHLLLASHLKLVTISCRFRRQLAFCFFGQVVEFRVARWSPRYTAPDNLGVTNRLVCCRKSKWQVEQSSSRIPRMKDASQKRIWGARKFRAP